jgi:hypothetical protein
MSSQNNKHAWDNGLKLNNRDKIYVRNLITNEQQAFRSVRKCSESFGDDSGHYISMRIEDKDINQVINSILDALKEKLNITLR